ncbi:MAG: DUF5688 family protein [Lachnospiraceae bacterium]|nr:DUF5688 family protein [Lachnospiraceae bacterium]
MHTTSVLISYETALPQITARLIGGDNTEPSLESAALMRVEDLYTVFYYRERNGALRLLTPEDLRTWNVQPQQLFADVLACMKINDPCRISPLNAVLGLSPEEEETGLFVLTNASGIFGAICILYPGVFEEIADRIGREFYILPCSVHEMLLLKKGTDLNEDELRKTIHDINRSELTREDILSDSLYCCSAPDYCFRRS